MFIRLKRVKEDSDGDFFLNGHNLDVEHCEVWSVEDLMMFRVMKSIVGVKYPTF